MPTLRSAFRKLSKELHPDTTSLPKDEAANKFQQICEAYETLADPILRKDYDFALDKLAIEEENRKTKSEYRLRNTYKTDNFAGDRRPLSGGELFSLLLLGIALLISLTVGIGFGLLQGRELIVRPSWLIIHSSIQNTSFNTSRNVTTTFKQNSIKSTFISRN